MAITARLMTAVGLLAATIPSAGADELRMDFSAGSNMEFNDNPRLVTQDIEAVTGIIMDAGLDASWSEESWQARFTPRVVGRRYTGDYELDSRDIFVNLALASVTERDTYDLSLDYRREGTLTSEFVATGVVDQNVPRESFIARAAATRAFTQRIDLNAVVSYEDTSYEDGLRYGLLDYNYWSALTYAQYSVSERSSANLIARIGRLDVPITGATSREITLGLGFDHVWSERWKMELSAGPTFSSFNDDSNTAGYSYRGSLAGAWERTTLQLDAEQILSPGSAKGRLQTRQSLRAVLSHSFRETIDGSVYVSDERYSDVGQLSQQTSFRTGSDRAGVAVNWRPFEQWGFQASFEHTILDADESPSSNRLLVGVTWRGMPRSKSL
jgi:hypothetical protein